MSEYPIEGLMNTAMNSIKDMVDVNTIIGDPIETTNNVVVIPVSKVNFGFVAGGTEFNGKEQKNGSLLPGKDEEEKKEEKRMPFGGGSGAGVSISPIAFIIIQQSGVKLLPVDHSSAFDKLLDFVPDLIEKTQEMISKKIDNIAQLENNKAIQKANDILNNSTNNKLNNMQNNKQNNESTNNKNEIIKENTNENTTEGLNKKISENTFNNSKNDMEIAKDIDYEYDETDM